MPRYNMFYQVHKGLRALLFETALQLQQTDFTDADEAEAAIDWLQQVSFLFDQHANGEDTFILPAAAAYEPSVADVFEKEHVKDHELAQRLNSLGSVYQHATTNEERTETGMHIQQAFIAFMVFNLEHMGKEETILNPLLWRYYTDAELMALTQKIVGRMEPEVLAKFSRWMVRGLNNPEIAHWVKGLERTAPDALLQGLLTTIENELPEHRYKNVQERLTEAAIFE